VARQLVDRIASLEVREPEPRQDIRAADDDHAEIDEVEQERQARREGGHDEDRAEDEELQAAEHLRFRAPA